MASDRRDAADRGGALGFGDGGFRPYEPKPGGFDWEAYQREYMQPRLRTPSPEPEPEPEPEYEPEPKYEPEPEPEPSPSPRGVAAAGGCSHCRGATAALLRG